ncbi:MAG: hypothetical protein CMA10_03115 [Euryarchaeota archaeon]|nr:hypothetical protein [Euryarchaeota archaeon]|tara:strand:+ start:2753 stop:3931 length:1179 start_codon:yes stop_codon:yes gene_type:complete
MPTLLEDLDAPNEGRYLHFKRLTRKIMTETLQIATIAVLVLGTILILRSLAKKDTVTGHLAPMLESQQQISETYTVMQNEYKQMKDTLADVRLEIQESQQGRKEVVQFSRDLRDVLMKPNIRGDAGEKLLEEMCNDFLPDSKWERQKVTEEEASSQQGGVDVLIKTGQLNVPVDSKFPREAWKRYVNLMEESLNGMDESEQKNHRNKVKKEFADFQKSVLTKVDEIQKHINPTSGTTDFALMFIPTEAMYYSVISSKNGLNEENLVTRKGQTHHLLDAMIAENVIPVSPSVFYPFISIILVGIKNMQVVDNLESLQKRLDLFEQKLGTFTSSYQDIGEALEKATSAYEDAGKRFEELKVNATKVGTALDEVELKDSPLLKESNEDLEIPSES